MCSKLIVFLSLTALASAGKFGDSLRQCNVDDRAALDRCLFQIVEDLRPFMPTGIPENNIPVLDPMLIDSLSLTQGGTVRTTFSNMQVKGLSKLITNSVTADPDRMTLRVKLTIPELRIIGKYTTSGRILLLDVEGAGTFWNVLGNVVVDGNSNLVLKGSPPNQIIQVADQNLDIQVSKIRLQLNNLFNGDPVLGQSINTFLNDNSQQVFAELKPEISKQVGGLVLKVMNDALSALPADKFLVKSG